MTYRILLADYKNADISAEIPSLFKKAGCTVDVFCSRDSWLLKNIRWDVWHEADTRSPSQYAKGLIDRVRADSYDWVVLTDDFAIRIMQGAIADDAIAAKILPISKLENRNILGSKAELSLLSQKYGLLTPPFALYSRNSDPVALGLDVSYPLLLKVDKSGGGKGIFFCSDASDVLAVLNSLPEKHKENLVFQKYIEGDNIAVEALYREGRLVAYASAKVMRNVDGEFSVSSVRTYLADYEIEDDLRRIGEALGINGFCSFTFMRDVTSKKLYLVEADLRPHAWFSLSRFAGIDFSVAIQHYLSKKDVLVRQPLLPGVAYVEVRHFFRDFNRSLSHGEFSSIMKWFLNTDGRWNFIPLHDWKTFLATLGQIARIHLYRFTFLRAPFRALFRLFRRMNNRPYGF